MGTITLYHGSSEIVEFPEIRKTVYAKDFSWGFYCTKSKEQAYRWAYRRAVNLSKDGFINFYEYNENSNLKILRFEKMTDEWLDFIAKCRAGFVHEYDIVEGPMADDTVWNYVNDFLANRISRELFWEYAKFKSPTHQISFHSLEALNCLKFVNSEVVHE